MEKQITVKSEYNSLEKILAFLKKESTFECSEEYDVWDVRTNVIGQMEKCVLIKKSNIHGMKLYFSKDYVLEMKFIIPDKMRDVYFGKNEKKYGNILELITGVIKNALLLGSQKKAFEEMKQPFNKLCL